jgi:hypothetical protein
MNIFDEVNKHVAKTKLRKPRTHLDLKASRNNKHVAQSTRKDTGSPNPEKY